MFSLSWFYALEIVKYSKRSMHETFIVRNDVRKENSGTGKNEGEINKAAYMLNLSRSL